MNFPKEHGETISPRQRSESSESHSRFRPESPQISRAPCSSLCSKRQEMKELGASMPERMTCRRYQRCHQVDPVAGQFVREFLEAQGPSSGRRRDGEAATQGGAPQTPRAGALTGDGAAPRRPSYSIVAIEIWRPLTRSGMRLPCISKCCCRTFTEDAAATS